MVAQPMVTGGRRKKTAPALEIPDSDGGNSFCFPSASCVVEDKYPLSWGCGGVLTTSPLPRPELVLVAEQRRQATLRPQICSQFFAV